MTTDRNPSTYLAFANLQMASEAFIASAVGDGKTAILRKQLISGNKYNSRFTATGADEFIANFKVLRHTDNPGRTDGDFSGTFGEGTGFSGTLFEYVGDNDPVIGLKKGDKIISLRSTEFVDDRLRDNTGTNIQDVVRGGFAFGRISDMESWCAGLRRDGLVSNGYFVTGYSLAGHLPLRLTSQSTGFGCKFVKTLSDRRQRIQKRKKAGS